MKLKECSMPDPPAAADDTTDKKETGNGGSKESGVVNQDAQTYQNTSQTSPPPAFHNLTGGDLSDLEDNEY